MPYNPEWHHDAYVDAKNSSERFQRRALQKFIEAAQHDIRGLKHLASDVYADARELQGIAKQLAREAVKHFYKYHTNS